ncbi:MAG: aspartate kinase, partial [Actinomycetes bacterium]
MALIVQKFGGSSLGDAQKIKHVANRVIETQRAGNQVVVVVSAMGDTTDELIDLAQSVAENPYNSPREMDMLLTSGERISMALVALAINAAGASSRSFTGSQAGIMTSAKHGDARISEVSPVRIQEALDAGDIAIVAGFQGFN